MVETALKVWPARFPASLLVDDEHFAYLRLQKGALSHLADARAAWQAALERSTLQDFALMRAFLPSECRSVLDVGSGLGTIDILLARHYGPGLGVCLLDGEDDAPIVSRHAETFNSMAVARDYLARNGVRHVDTMSPPNLTPRPFDLVISLGSWCFHYPPAEYLEFVRECCHAATVLILDVRRERPAWTAQLAGVFRMRARISFGQKFDRMVFVPK